MSTSPNMYTEYSKQGRSSLALQDLSTTISRNQMMTKTATKTTTTTILYMWALCMWCVHFLHVKRFSYVWSYIESIRFGYCEDGSFVHLVWFVFRAYSLSHIPTHTDNNNYNVSTTYARTTLAIAPQSCAFVAADQVFLCWLWAEARAASPIDTRLNKMANVRC